MNTCKTCAHWKADKDDYSDQICNPWDPDTLERMEMPFEVRVCEHPAKLFCERPLEPNGFALADGSEYRAELYTAEDFGCVRHEELPVSEARG